MWFIGLARKNSQIQLTVPYQWAKFSLEHWSKSIVRKHIHAFTYTYSYTLTCFYCFFFCNTTFKWTVSHIVTIWALNDHKVCQSPSLEQPKSLFLCYNAKLCLSKMKCVLFIEFCVASECNKIVILNGWFLVIIYHENHESQVILYVFYPFYYLLRKGSNIFFFLFLFASVEILHFLWMVNRSRLLS